MKRSPTIPPKAVLFLAPPMSGKGTQTELLALAHPRRIIPYGMSQIFELAKKTDAKLAKALDGVQRKGLLLDCDVTIGVFKKFFNPQSCIPVIEGVPRTSKQVVLLHEVLFGMGFKEIRLCHLSLNRAGCIKRYDARCSAKDRKSRSDKDRTTHLDRLSVYSAHESAILSTAQRMGWKTHSFSITHDQCPYCLFQQINRALGFNGPGEHEMLSMLRLLQEKEIPVSVVAA